MTLIGGSIIAYYGVIFAKPILLALGTAPDVMHLSLPYVQWMLAGSPLLFIYIIYTSILRGCWRQYNTADCSGMTIGTGLIITPVLIAGKFGFPQLGYYCPAIASHIGFLIALVFLYFYLKKKDHPLNFDFELITSYSPST